MKDGAQALSIKQNALWNTVGAFIYQGCQWLTTILVVVLSDGYANSGILAFAMATGNIFSNVAIFNAHTYQISDTKNRFSSNNYVGFRFLTLLLSVLVVVVYTAALTPGAETLAVLVCYLLFKSDESIVNVFYGIEQKAERMDYIGISLGLRGIASISAFTIALMITDELLLAVLAMFLSCAAITLLFDIRNARKFSGIKPAISKEIASSLFLECLPYAISVFFFCTLSAIPRQYFGIEYGSEALGVYAAIATPCVVIQVLAHYLYAPFLVPIANSFSEGDKQKGISLIGKSIMAIGIASAICLAFAVLFGSGFVVALYGSDIYEYSWMFTPAMVVTTLMAVDVYLMDLLIVFRMNLSAVILNVISVIACFMFMDYCFSSWYINGINIVLIVSLCLSCCFGAIVTARHIKNI